MSIEILSEIMPEWRIEKLLGEGSHGKVYQIIREEHSITVKACAFDSKKRFQTPTAFKNALTSVKDDKPLQLIPVTPLVDPNETVATRRAPVAQKPDGVVENFGGKKRKSRDRKVLFPFVVVIFFVGVAFGLYFVNPGGIFDGIIRIFVETPGEVNGDLVEEVDDALYISMEDRLDSLAADFLNEEIEFSSVIMELNTIERMDHPESSDQLNTTRAFVNDLNDSRTAFNTAEAMFERGDFAGAISQYSLVILEDPNYDRSVNGAMRATNAFRTESLTTARAYSANGDYGSAIRVLNSALVVIENDSELTQRLNIYTAAYETARRSEAVALAQVTSAPTEPPTQITSPPTQATSPPTEPPTQATSPSTEPPTQATSPPTVPPTQVTSAPTEPPTWDSLETVVRIHRLIDDKLQGLSDASYYNDASLLTRYIDPDSLFYRQQTDLISYYEESNIIVSIQEHTIDDIRIDEDGRFIVDVTEEYTVTANGSSRNLIQIVTYTLEDIDGEFLVTDFALHSQD